MPMFERILWVSILLSEKKKKSISWGWNILWKKIQCVPWDVPFPLLCCCCCWMTLAGTMSLGWPVPVVIVIPVAVDKLWGNVTCWVWTVAAAPPSAVAWLLAEATMTLLWASWIWGGPGCCCSCCWGAVITCCWPREGGRSGKMLLGWTRAWACGCRSGCCCCCCCSSGGCDCCGCCWIGWNWETSFSIRWAKVGRDKREAERGKRKWGREKERERKWEQEEQ